MQMRRILVLVVALVVVLAACGGDDDDNNTLAGAGTTVSGDNGNDDNGDDNGDDGDDGGGAFADLIDDTSDVRVRVSYETTNTSDGQTSTDEFMTLSQDGSGKVAYFYDGEDNQIIIDGDSYTMCSNVKSEPECTALDGGSAQGAAAAYAGLFNVAKGAIAAADGAGGYTDESTETIAGREAECVSIDYLGGKWKTCADKETGILLLWEGSGEGSSSSFKATEFGEPKDSDFTPPATPQTIPGLGG
jgi:hypothetical protein